MQNRWKLNGNKLIYYGLRNKENMFNNTVRLNSRQAELISLLPKCLNDSERIILKNLIGVQIVKKEKLKEIPKNLNEAVFCKK